MAVADCVRNFHAASIRFGHSGPGNNRPVAGLRRGRFSGIIESVSLRILQRRVSLWIQRPIGQLVALLLLVAMVSAGMPTGKVHSHAEGDHGHDHFAQVAADGPSDHGVPAAAPVPADTVLHAHDVGTTVPALLKLPVLAVSVLVPMAPGASIAAPPPPSAARIPPHRPPIA